MSAETKFAQCVAWHVRRQGFLDVRLEHEVAKTLWTTRGRRFIPFDVSYIALGPLPHREYLECKHHRRDGAIPVATEQEVGKFLCDLRTCGLPPGQGGFVTNLGYSPLARDYARCAGLRLYVLKETSEHDSMLNALCVPFRNAAGTIRRLIGGPMLSTPFQEIR